MLLACSHWLSKAPRNPYEALTKALYSLMRPLSELYIALRRTEKDSIEPCKAIERAPQSRLRPFEEPHGAQ